MQGRHVTAAAALVAALVTTLGIASVDPARAAASAQDRCEVAKVRAAIALARSEAGCRATARTRGRPVDPACIARAETRFAAALANAGARPGCSSGAGSGAFGAEVQRFLDALELLASAPAPTPTPEPTPVPSPGDCGAAHCCVGVGLSGAGCAFEAWDDGGLTTAEQSCTSRGGTWQAGRCPEACALPAGCCVRANGCGAVGVYGPVDVANLGLFCPLVDATAQVGACPD